MTSLLLRLAVDDTGQDVVEYALLAALIGLASIASFGLLQDAIAGTYGSWNSGTNDIWQPPDPSAGA
jgi:Flp pilus assembly pilin Flp